MTEHTVKIFPGFFLSLAVGLILVPFRWLVAWLIAAAFHEVCHLLALRLCGCNIYAINIGASGAKIEADMPSSVKMALCAMAGPAGGLLLLLLLRVAPRVALCGLAQSTFNLLPVYPLDGGRALAGITVALFGVQKGKKVMRIIETVITVCMIALSLYASFYRKLGILPVLFTVFILARNKKIPCKQGLLRVQYP